MFNTYLQLGFDHISDLNAYDHIIFIIALCAVYSFKEWKKVLILVTAFTIGHSVTLALAVFDIVRFPAAWIELLIPITIILTSLHNVYSRPDDHSNTLKKNVSFNYYLALFFGFIHGMGFSNFLRSIMMPGEEGLLWKQLLAFNIGIELGQLLIVAIILVISFGVLHFLKVSQKSWNIFISGAAAGIALMLIVELLQG